jgi:hypothetical protein
MPEALSTVQTIVGLAAKLSVPVYFLLQLWLPFRWTGGWRVAALLPLILMTPALAWLLYALSGDSNLGLLIVILLAPPCCLYQLALVALHRAGRPLRQPDDVGRPLRQPDDDGGRRLRQAGGGRGGYTR